MASPPAAGGSTLPLLLRLLGLGLDLSCLRGRKALSIPELLAERLKRYVYVIVTLVSEGCPRVDLVPERKRF